MLTWATQLVKLYDNKSFLWPLNPSKLEQNSFEGHNLAVVSESL